jgi:hypothetical protein
MMMAVCMRDYGQVVHMRFEVCGMSTKCVVGVKSAVDLRTHK